MATYVLIPGASSTSWFWHLVVPRLEARGHEVVAVDLPSADDSAGLDEYARAVVAAIEERGDRRTRDDVILVAQSMAGFTAPLVCERVPVALVVLIAAMVPLPGEAPGDWWAKTGQPEAARRQALHEGRDPDDDDPAVLFLHDVPPDVAAEVAEHVVDQSGTPFATPWPGKGWPDVPTRFLLCRHDRLFPADFLRRVARERLGIVPDEMDGGHLPALARPDQLVERLEAYRVDVLGPGGTA